MPLRLKIGIFKMSVNFNTIQFQNLTVPVRANHCPEFNLVMTVPLEWIQFFSVNYEYNVPYGSDDHHHRNTVFSAVEVLNNSTLEYGSLKGEADYSGEKSLAVENLGLSTDDSAEARRWQHIKFKCTRQKVNVPGVSNIRSVKYSILPSGDRPAAPEKPLPVSGDSGSPTTKIFTEQEIIDAWNADLTYDPNGPIEIPPPEAVVDQGRQTPDITDVTITPNPNQSENNDAE